MELCYNFAMVIKYGSEPDPARRIRIRQGENIRKARVLRGMTPAELAEAVGVTVSAISQWETGRYSPRQHHQLAICRALDVAHSFVFGLDVVPA